MKIGLIFLARKRPGFDMQWGADMQTHVRDALGSHKWDVVEPATTAVDELSLRAAISECEHASVDAVVLLQTTMSDGRMVLALSQSWPDPPVFWATPENPQGDIVSSCSLVGVHVWASAMRHLGRTCETVYGHPQDADTMARLSEAVALVSTVRRLRSLRMALVGGQAPGFFTMQGDLFAMYQELGVALQSHTLVEFADIVKSISESAVAADVDRVKQLRLPHSGTTDDDLSMASRLYLAMRHFFDNEHYDALAVRCWPEMPNLFGQWCYLGMARLADEGFAVSCEGDVDGALAAWLGKSLGMGPGYLTDWLAHDQSTITFWHGGLSPMSLSPPQGEPGAPHIARHFNSKKPAVVDAELKADMPVTIWRLWRIGGKYRISAREGRTLRPRRPLQGTNALVELDGGDPQTWFDDLCYYGMPHHVTLHFGQHVDTLRRFARLLEMEWVK